MIITYLVSKQEESRNQVKIPNHVEENSWCQILQLHAIYISKYTVQLMTKFTNTLVSSGVPRHILKITCGLFLNARVLQHTYKYLMHVSSARE